MFTESTVQASPYTVIRSEPIDVLMLWDGGTREVLSNVTLVWQSSDNTRQTFRTENGNVRHAATPQRHNGHNYRGGKVEAVILRSTGELVTPTA